MYKRNARFILKQTVKEISINIYDVLITLCFVIRLIFTHLKCKITSFHVLKFNTVTLQLVTDNSFGYSLCSHVERHIALHSCG
jgi:hypothetical protein